MELIGKTEFGRTSIERHGKDWSVVSSDEKTHLLMSEKTGQKMRVLIEADPNFYKITQERFL